MIENDDQNDNEDADEDDNDNADDDNGDNDYIYKYDDDINKYSNFVDDDGNTSLDIYVKNLLLYRRLQRRSHQVHVGE